ncbi:MAG: hypothetical protein ACJAVM_003050 [Sulfitobacter sp.]|jgi:hypothetical protein
MPETSPILSLPYLQPAQAQKHVTHNEALRILDAVTQLSVRDANLTAPPPAPANGDCFIVAAGATGLWEGQENNIAVLNDNAWVFFTPKTGWRADLGATGGQLRFDGALWHAAIAAVDLQNLPAVGIGTTADATNRLAVASEASLLNHDGAGHQLKLNKAAAADTASLLFQTGFSGRAEMGTAGNDDFSIKVSADGGGFHTALAVDGTSGAVQFPSGQSFFEDVFILDDTAWGFDIPWSDPSRIMMWISADIAAQFYLVAITGPLSGATNFAEIFANPSGSLNFLSGVLSGTTGPDGEISLSIDTSGPQPRMYIENRLGSDRLFALATMGK